MRAVGPSRPMPAGPVSFRETLSAEWTKIFTVRSTFWALAIGVVTSIGLAVAMAVAVITDDGLDPATIARFDSTAYGLAGLHSGMVAFGVLGVLFITGEYAGGMIHVSLAATPGRTGFLIAKIIVLGGVVLFVGELASIGSFLLSQGIYATRGLDSPLPSPLLARAVVGSGIYLALVALLGLAVGTILRRTARSVTTLLIVLFVVPVVGAVLPGEWGKVVNKMVPTNAGGAIMGGRASEASLAPWTGIAVFALYTALVMAVAVLLFERRDA